MSVQRWSALMLVSTLACVHQTTSEAPAGESVSYQLAVSDAGIATGLNVEFCHAGACKVALAPQYDLNFQVDWTECTASPGQSPFAANTSGVMLWPTTIVDLAIPLADSGWLCKLPPNNAKSECIVSASQSARELYIWGPVEAGCSFLWGVTPNGIDAALGAGCGMCKLEQSSEAPGASYAFNMGFDLGCRCPKAHFTAVAAKH